MKTSMIKTLFISLLASLVFAACTSQPASTDTPTEQKIADDASAIASTIHGFYGWYNTFTTDTTHFYPFIDESGKHPRLNADVLEKYLDNFRKSGFVSEEFIANEKKYYAACAKLWENEDAGDIPSGMDADKIYCAQDGEYSEFVTTPVSAQVNGDKATATLMFPENSPNGIPRSFELKKENGKWLLTKVVCDMGVAVD